MSYSENPKEISELNWLNNLEWVSKILDRDWWTHRIDDAMKLNDQEWFNEWKILSSFQTICFKDLENCSSADAYEILKEWWNLCVDWITDFPSQSNNVILKFDQVLLGYANCLTQSWAQELAWEYVLPPKSQIAQLVNKKAWFRWE